MTNNKKMLSMQLYRAVLDDKDAWEVKQRKIKYLVRLGADINDKDEKGDAYIMFGALNSRDFEVFKLLLDLGGDVNAMSGGRALVFEAVLLEDVRFLRKIVENGANLNRFYKYGLVSKTPLMQALALKNLEAVKILIEGGADVNMIVGVKVSALDIVCNNDDLKMARLLLENGADANKKGFLGKRALMDVKSVDMAKLLVEFGANVNAKDSFGNSVLLKHVMEEHPRVDVIEYLIDKGANVWTKNDMGKDCVSMCDEGLKDIILECWNRKYEDKKEVKKSFWKSLFGGR